MSPLSFQMPRRRTLLLAGLLLAGCAVRVWFALDSPSVYWGDGIFQILEPAHDAVFGYGITPMEYKEGLRSWIFPGVVAALMWLGEPLGPGSWGYLTLVAVALSALSLLPAYAAYRWSDPADGDSGEDLAWLPLLAMVPPLVWTELVYFGPKALFEVIATHLFVGGLLLLHESEGGWLGPGLAGLIFGICCINRPHLVPAVAAVGGAVLLFDDDRYRCFSWMIVGTAAGLAIGGVIDLLTWGAPFHSVLANAYHNVVEDKANRWGTSPGWQYPVWIWQVSPVGALALAAAVIAGLVRRPLLAWPAAAILVAHSGIAHKEYRFIYPAIALGTMLVGVELSALVAWIQRRFERRIVTRGVAALAVVLCLGVSGLAASQFNLRSTGKTGETTNWRFHQGGLLALRHLSTRSDLCGVGLMQFDWGRWSSGGYTYLHRDLPIVMLRNTGELRNRASAFDVVVAEGWDPERTEVGDFELERCFQDTCILSRSGDCQVPDGLPVGR